MAASYAAAGWLGYIELFGGGTSNALRFTDESINIPQSTSKMSGVHAGQRNSGVFQYNLVQPSGSISFPLITTLHTMDIGNHTGSARTLPSLDGITAQVLSTAIKPWQDSTYPPTDVPSLGTTTIYRGDVVKSLGDTWVDSLSVTGQAGGSVSCSVDVVSTSGVYSEQGTAGQSGFNNIVRAVHFNELSWGNYSDFNLTRMGGSSLGSGDVQLRPRNFTFSSKNNLKPDDSYHPEDPLSILGFTFTEQDIECQLTFVGAYVPNNPDTEVVINNINMGGLYTIESGLWTAKTLLVPGTTDIAVTQLSLTGINAGLFGVIPTSAIAS